MSLSLIDILFLITVALLAFNPGSFAGKHEDLADISRPVREHVPRIFVPPSYPIHGSAAVGVNKAAE